MDPINFVDAHREDAIPTEFEEETDGSETAVIDADDEQLVLSTSVITSPELHGENVNKARLI